MTKEEALEFKAQHPSHYTIMLPRKHPDAYAAILHFNEGHGFHDIPFPQMFYNWTHDVTEWPKCDVCGKPAAFSSMGKFGYAATCSRLCARKSKTTLEHRKKAALEKFGCEHSTQNEEVKRKIRESTVKHYGVDCILKSDEFRKKIKQTNLEKYGVEYPMMSVDVKARREENNIKKYGVGSPMQTEASISKMLATTQSRFGCIPSPQSQKNLAEYNKEKQKAAYENLKTAYPDYELLTTESEYEHRAGHLKWKCRNCGAVFETLGHTSLYPKCKCRHRDQEEIEFYNYIKSIVPDAILNTRKSLPSGREIDVYIPSRKIGFEFDGLYWHSELRVTNNYHASKTNEAESVGIRLIHVFSDEWEQKQQIVRESIRALLSPHKAEDNIYARKCECREVPHDEAHKFLDETHIQGSDNAKTYMGLYHDGTLVAVASFQPEKKNGNAYFLSRYSTISRYTVCGGLGKLLSNFIKTYRPSNIKTYADRRCSQGGIYEKTGFKRTATIPPKYWYTRDFRMRIHRFNLRKSEFNKNGLMYESNSTEKQLAEMNGFVRIYDCGYYRYELECK